MLIKEAQDKGVSLRLFVALVHYPVYNRKREVVATAITNLDVHDLARATRTYGGEAYFIVNPLERQRWLLNRIVNHWQFGYGAQTHPNRRDALSIVIPVGSVDEALKEARRICGHMPTTVGTTARIWPKAIGFSELRSRMSRGGAYMILFGTGWGLTDEILHGCDVVLDPIRGVTDYNHLSVRSAAAIILDRLLGPKQLGGAEPVGDEFGLHAGLSKGGQG